MDHTQKLEMTQPKTLREASRILVGLTHDDILTLKLLRDGYAKELFENRYRIRENPNARLALETLERILKQVG